MRDDNLLRRLGQAAREQGRSGPLFVDERWDRLAAGTLSAEQDAELRRLAESSEEAREHYEAFRPLGPAFHARVMKALVEQERKEATPARGPSPAPVPVPKPLPFPSWKGHLAAWGAAVGAAAAMIAYIVVPPAALPLYAVAEVSGGTRTTRGELVEMPTLLPGDHLEASIRPETTVRRASSLRAKAFLQHGEELRPFGAKTELDDQSGAVRISGMLDRDLAPGPWTLWLVVGRRGSLPDPGRLRALAAGAPYRESDWVAVSVSLTIGANAKE